MPGAWEVGHQGSCLCAILHVDTTTVAWALGLRELQIPGPIMPLAGMTFDHARNAACMRAIEMGVDSIFFIDSDVIAPKDTILRLMAHGQPIVSGIYARRSPPVGVPVMMRGGQWVTEYPANSLIEVDLVGAGCLLIQTDLLKKLPPQRPGSHWFDWRVHLQGLLPVGECLSEDFTFCTHCKKNGYKVLVDTSIICKHVGFAEATPGNFGSLVT